MYVSNDIDVLALDNIQPDVFPGISKNALIDIPRPGARADLEDSPGWPPMRLRR